MNLYDVVVRIGGSLYNEVERHGLAAPEVLLLRELHGSDSVRRIVHVGVSNELDSAIRARLSTFYGTGEVETLRSGAELVKGLFGPKTMPLPNLIDGIEHINPQVGKEAPLRTEASLTAGGGLRSPKAVSLTAE